MVIAFLKENDEYVNSIIQDVKWLGYNVDDKILFASDYFEKMYEYAIVLINKGLAYVDDQSAEEIRKSRGTLKSPGINSPFRDRTIEENLNLFEVCYSSQIDLSILISISTLPSISLIE